MSLLNIRVEFNFNKKEIDFELVENLRKLKNRRGIVMIVQKILIG